MLSMCVFPFFVLSLRFLFYSRAYVVVCCLFPQAAHFKSESLRCLPQSAGRLPKLIILASVCLTPESRGALVLKNKPNGERAFQVNPFTILSNPCALRQKLRSVFTFKA